MLEEMCARTAAGIQTQKSPPCPQQRDKAESSFTASTGTFTDTMQQTFLFLWSRYKRRSTSRKI